jgi:outer membrane protein
MKKLLVLFFVLFVIPSYAVSAQEVKIGFVDLQRALNESEAGKKAKAELEAIIKEKQSRIDEKIMRKEKIRKELEMQATVLSENAIRQRQDELDRMERDIQRLIDDSNAEIQRRQRQMELSILKELDAIITELGKEEGYTIILPAEVILYSGEGTDITDRVIEKYDKSKSSSHKQNTTSEESNDPAGKPEETGK